MLPFRITTADSLLGEGLAELLAQEFTGEGGPRAIDMSSTLSAWRKAGGELRTPVGLDSGMALARRVGAGILLQGNVVGVGNRLTIAASMINSMSGAPVGVPVRVSGAADSLESLVRQTAAALLSGSVGQRVLKSSRLSSNPAALRSYIEGLAAWRRGATRAAVMAFEASVAADSLFASALYQRWLLSAAYAGVPDVAGNWQARVRARVALLTDRERAVFDAYATDVPRPRTEVYQFARRTAERLGDSPDAWFVVADYVYHDGVAVVGPDSVVPLARQFFSLAVGLDTQPVFLFHLVEVAINTADTALMRRLRPAVSTLTGDGWATRWSLAAALHDQRALDALRRERPPADWGAQSRFVIAFVMGSSIEPALYEDFYQQLSTVRADVPLATTLSRVEWVHGRPAAARNFDGVARSVRLHTTGDRIDTLILTTVGPGTLPDTVNEAARQCVRARLTLDRGETVDLTVTSIRLNARCRSVLQAYDAFNRKTLTDSALTALDTLATYVRNSTFLGFEHRLLARIYESRGDTARAVRAITLYPHDYVGAWAAPTYREAGRLFLMSRDTAKAIRAYDHYLQLRTDAEPMFIAERDSVKAIVARLTRRVVP